VALWKGILAGVAGGIAGTWVMSQFQAVVWRVRLGNASGSPEERRPDDRLQASDPHETEEGDATVVAAEALSESALGRPLSEQEEEIAGPAVHYAFGALSGAMYGGLNELTPRARTGYGLPFGTAVWLGGVELAVPALGLSRPPAQYPLSMHLYALTAHLVYGLTADIVSRAVRRAI
jgi:hypothetical protein